MRAVRNHVVVISDRDGLQSTVPARLYKVCCISDAVRFCNPLATAPVAIARSVDLQVVEMYSLVHSVLVYVNASCLGRMMSSLTRCLLLLHATSGHMLHKQKCPKCQTVSCPQSCLRPRRIPNRAIELSDSGNASGNSGPRRQRQLDRGTRTPKGVRADGYLFRQDRCEHLD